jgi:ribosome-binding protein aMBF1 (putative translation factor)
MKRPYVSSFEDVALPAEAQRAVSNPPVGRPTPRSPLIRQKHAKTKPSWYAVQAFADVLLTERERRQWGQTATASHVGMGVSQYRKLETGVNAPSIWLANRLCRRLGITFSLGSYPE